MNREPCPDCDDQGFRAVAAFTDPHYVNRPNEPRRLGVTSITPVIVACGRCNALPMERAQMERGQ